MTDSHFRAPQSVITDTAPARQVGNKAFIIVVIAIVMAVGFLIVQENRARQQYLIKAKLSKIVASLDPVKTAIAMTYRKNGKVTAVMAAVTQSNQGKPATPDWVELGFTTLPTLPREASSLAVTPEGEIIVTLASLGADMDNTEVRAIPVKGGQGMSWTYTCTSENATFKRYFHC